MNGKWSMVAAIAVVIGSSIVYAQVSPQTAGTDDSASKPPVGKADIEIVRRARQILDSPARWNRADDRNCPEGAKTFSLYCALEKATDEVSGHFEHRGAAMQEARFVIDEVLAKGNNYEHRLMNYNNDPKTSFPDVQRFFRLLEERIQKRLQEQDRHKKPAARTDSDSPKG
jgi:hypothetical protein